MTLGGSGGSPKTLQTVDFALGGGVSTNATIYTVPLDTYAIIRPIYIFGNGSGAQLLSLGVKNNDSVNGGTVVQNLGYPAATGSSGSPGKVLPAVMGTTSLPSGGSSGTSIASWNEWLARFAEVFNGLSVSGNGSSEYGSTIYGDAIILWPNEVFVGSFNILGSSGKLRYSLTEYGIAS